MIGVLADDAEIARRRPMAFLATRDERLADKMVPAVEVGGLVAQIELDPRRATGAVVVPVPRTCPPARCCACVSRPGWARRSRRGTEFRTSPGRGWCNSRRRRARGAPRRVRRTAFSAKMIRWECDNTVGSECETWNVGGATRAGNRKILAVARSAPISAARPAPTDPLMPTYDYVCETCEHEFEFSQSIKDKRFTRCPASVCPRRIKGKGRVKRRLGGGAGLLFKGSGFYITDYRSESYKTAAKSDAPPAAAAADSAAPAGKSEAKAETKSEGKADRRPERRRGDRRVLTPRSRSGSPPTDY